MLLLEGVRTFEVAAVLEVFNGGTPSGATPPHEIRFASPSGRRLRLEYGLEIATTRLRLADAPDLLIVPGVVDLDRLCADIDEGRLADEIATISALHRGGTQLVSLCTGAFLLAAAGVLDGREATTHWYSIDQLRRRHPAVQVRPKVLYTHDADARVWTSAGVTAAIDLCLAILAAEEGAAAAAESARGMVVAAVRTGGQSQFVPPRHAEQEVVGSEYEYLQELVRGALDRSWSVVEMASAVHQAPRTLQRRFTTIHGVTPSQWLLRERIATAQEMLMTTALSMEQIARRVGFRSTGLMRKHFAAAVGVSPTRYREVFKRPLDRAQKTVTGRRAPFDSSRLTS